MGGEAALNQRAEYRGQTTDGGGQMDEELFDRFLLYRERAGLSDRQIAKKLARSAAQLSQYVNRKFVGDLAEFEKDVENLLRREEDLQFVSDSKSFCSTTAATLMWEVMQFCDERRKMGAVLAPSGTGKTDTCIEYKKQNRPTVYVTAHIKSHTAGAVLKLIAKPLIGTIYRHSLAELLDAVIERLKGSSRLLLIDDAHFLSWEAFEMVRKIHDCGGVGVVYVGQERLYDQMRGTDPKGYLFDQIYSRIAIKRERFQIKKQDVRMVANSICKGLDKPCIDFLYEKARGKGRLRKMRNLLDVAVASSEYNRQPITMEMLMQAERFLME
jgi:DNA transposition AAA+ family ATPase